jgi:hypothetical protein
MELVIALTLQLRNTKTLQRIGTFLCQSVRWSEIGHNHFPPSYHRHHPSVLGPVELSRGRILPNPFSPSSAFRGT